MACVFLIGMRTLVRGLAIGRVVVGAAMVLKPEEAVRGWIGPRTASKGGTQTLTRALGARDLVLGAGALASGGGRDWVAAGLFSDVVDLAATVHGEDLPASGRALVVLVAGAAIGVGAAYLVVGAGEG